MLKLKKKVFFAGLTLAILAPIAAQSGPNDLLNKMEVGFCDLSYGPVCNPNTKVDVASANHKQAIQPYLDENNGAYIGICTKNAISDLWAKFEGIKDKQVYKDAMKHYADSCVNGQKRASVLPQPVIVANVIRNLRDKSHPQYVLFYGKILGPDGKVLAHLFSDSDNSIRYNSEIIKKSRTNDEDGVVSVRDVCPNEKDFADGLANSDDGTSSIDSAANQLAAQIEQLAADCGHPADHTSRGAPSLDKISQDIAPPSLNQVIEGSSAASGA